MLTEKAFPSNGLEKAFVFNKDEICPEWSQKPKSQTSQSILPKRNWTPIIMPLNCIKTLWLKQAGLYFLMKEAIAARVNDGVLTVTLPKMSKPECPAARQIEVK